MNNNPLFSTQEFPLEKDIMMANEKGVIVPLKRQTIKMEISSYWEKQSFKVGLLLALSSLILIVVLINESKIFIELWTGVLTFITTVVFGLLGM